VTVSLSADQVWAGAPFAELQDLVNDRPTAGADLIADNLDFVTTLGEPVRFVALLRDILANESTMALIAARSYRHVNHFDKLVLVDSGDAACYRLTLHLWDPPYTETEVRDELIHDHRFSFWSNILTGELVSENFGRDGDGDPVHLRQYRYVPEKLAESTHTNFYEFVGDAPLMRTVPSRESTGGSYYLYYERIHRVVLPTEHMTCTLVLRGPRARNHSNVYNTVYPDQNLRAQNAMFTVAELRARLAKLATTIERTRISR
jgi:hypothetical protein